MLKNTTRAAAALSILAFSLCAPVLAAQKTPGVIKAESASKFPANGRKLVTAPDVNNSFQDVADSFIPILSTNSNCFWKANGASPATCEAAAGTTDASALTSGTLNVARLPSVVARKDQTGTWDLRQTFMSMPALPSTNCYVKSNGTGAAATCDSAATIFGSSTYTAPGTGAASRAVSDKLQDVVSVFDYLSDAEKFDVRSGAGTINLKNSIQNAENALGTIGGKLYFGTPGVYLWDSTILLSSSRHVECAKGVVFKPRYRFSLFANDNWATIDLRTDLDPPTDANQTDHDFEISGCKFDWTAAVNADSPSLVWPYNNGHKPAIFVKAKNVYVHDNEFVALDPPPQAAGVYYGFVGSVGCVSTSNCRYERNIGKGLHESLDCWGGGKGCYYKDNRVELFDNSTFQRGDHYCLGFNGMGSIANFHNTIEDLVVSGNSCVTKGYSSCFQFDPLSAGSIVKKVKIVNNACEAKSGTTNNGIYGRGQISDVLIEGNSIKGVDALPINVTDFFSTGGPFTCTDCISTTNGSDIATVAITTLTDAKATVGNYLLFSAGTGAVGGITFASKYFLITEVTSGVNVKVKADVAATSTAGPLGGSVSANVWWGAPDGVKIANNHFDGSSYLNSALVYGVGTNLHISDTSAVGGTYGAITFASSIIRGATTLPLPVVYGTSGSAGTGMAGTSGDNTDNYGFTRNPRTSFPAIVLACGADPTTAALVNGEMWCNTTALRARIGGASKTLADLESAQTLSGVKTFSAAPVLSAGAQFSAVAVGSLPTCNAGALGVKRYVNDATQTLTAGIGAAVTGGGANTVPVGCDGANWRIGG